MMSVEQELSGCAQLYPTMLTVGVFDGVHVGHQTLLKRLVRRASEEGLVPGVITFKQHPMTFLSPKEAPPKLLNSAENLKLINAQGVSVVIPLDFNASLAHVDANTFAVLLQRYLKMKGLILGWDFVMGHHRSGTISSLESLGKELGFVTETVHAVTIDNEVVSSTAIRQALADGVPEKAMTMLGRPFSIKGCVVEGEGRGVGLGYPTANIDVDPDLAVPAEGVYATWAHINDCTFPAVTAISRCPTFDGYRRTVETHILNYSAEIYNKEIKIDIIKKLRGIRRFGKESELIEQIRRDIAQASELLGNTI